MWCTCVNKCNSCYHSDSLRRTKIALSCSMACWITVITAKSKEKLKKTHVSRLYCTLSTATYSRWNRFTFTYVRDLQKVNKSSEWWEAINRQLTSLIPFFHTSIMFLSSKEHCYSEKIFQTARKLVDLRAFSNHITHFSIDTPSSWINSARHEKRHHPQTQVISKRQRSRPVTLSRS